MSDFQYKILKRDEPSPKIVLSGEVNEFSNFDFLDNLPSDSVIIDTKEIDRINSFGVRVWINAFKSISDKLDIKFINCSEAILTQASMISNFIKADQIDSGYIPYYCRSCDIQESFLINFDDYVEDDEFTVPSFQCSNCESEMKTHEDPHDLFSFLED